MRGSKRVAAREVVLRSGVAYRPVLARTRPLRPDVAYRLGRLDPDDESGPLRLGGEDAECIVEREDGTTLAPASSGTGTGTGARARQRPQINCG